MYECLIYLYDNKGEIVSTGQFVCDAASLREQLEFEENEHPSAVRIVVDIALRP